MHAEVPDALHDTFAERSAASGPADLALDGLCVLDLSVSLPGKGGMSGTLPDGFSALTQLQVCCMLVDHVGVAFYIDYGTMSTTPKAT
jgi:hypothetical protein